MENQFERTEILLGHEAIEKLHNAHVAVFGLGGVGGYVCEALARSGVGTFTLVDKDTVSITNLNRQIIATQNTVGMVKTEAMKERILSINPGAKIFLKECFFLPETSSEFNFSDFTYIVDAVDTVSAKIELARMAQEYGIPVISAMGAGNKLDPTRFKVADISETSVCPLARVMRHELKKRGIKKLKVVYSDEKPAELLGVPSEQESTAKKIPGSTAFVPAVAGLIIAGEVIKDIAGR